jgi:drug/metabolite transporter (DMT)-like permease
VSAYTGEIAGLLTSVCWSFTSIFFTLSGRMVGSPVVNRTRLVLALVMVTTLHWVTQGQPLPVDAGPTRWGWFALSGLAGFVIGDAFLFQAFVLIGPRLSMLLMALYPVMGTLMAWVLLSEKLAGGELLGIALALGGVAWVVTDRRNGSNGQPDTLSPRSYVIGVLFGLGGALGQASGVIASKQGLKGDFPPLSGNLMRLVVSTAAIWLIAVLAGQAASTMSRLRANPRAIRFILIGATAGPFIGVTLSLIAVQKAPVGIASTLTSLTPIILLPLGYVFFHERISRRAVTGTVIAVTGTALIFLKPDLGAILALLRLAR